MLLPEHELKRTCSISLDAQDQKMLRDLANTHKVSFAGMIRLLLHEALATRGLE